MVKTKPRVADERWRFVSDDDGHNYLIKAEDVQAFEEWTEAGPYWEGYTGHDFEEEAIDGVNDYTFTDPRVDG